MMHGRVGHAPPPIYDSHSLCGTPEYMAPEVLLGQECCETVDFWSLGCFVCELLCDVGPFGMNHENVQGAWAAPSAPPRSE